MEWYSDEAENAQQLEGKVQHEETNKKLRAKEGKLKAHWNRTKQFR